ncbi:hypothetical protein HOY82DRAFT_544266 [Tuber indicum]|nr:hypothetical protein HOY82DRAFT_544266 [Tuber indicum]
MVVQEITNYLQENISPSYTQLRDGSVALTEDTVDISTEHDLDNIERDELAQWLQQKSRRWPQLVVLENMLDDMEISEEEAFMCMQEEDQEREGTEESSESFKQGTSDRQEDVQVEKDSSGWPKLSGLEQILYDMEIERVATENMMGKKLKSFITEDLNQVENYSSEEEQEQDIQKRKEKNVFRLSHIRDCNIADLRFQEEENTSSNENTVDHCLQTYSTQSSPSAYQFLPSIQQTFHNSLLSSTNLSVSDGSASSSVSTNPDIIEISSDSDSDVALMSNDVEDVLNHLVQHYSLEFGCSQHYTTPSPTTGAPSWPMTRITEWINHNLPVDYPVPGKFGYTGRVTSQQWQSILCGTTEESSVPPVLETPTAGTSSSTHIRYDIDSFIAKASCLSVAKKGLRVQFSPSCLKNISSDIHLYSKIDTLLVSGKIHTHHVPLHCIPHFYLGHLTSCLHLPIYVFLPGLWNFKPNGKANSYVSNLHLQQWMDIGFIPSIHRHYPSDYLQHLPVSFSSASAKTFARGRELGIQDGRFESGKRQELHYFLSGRYLKSVWQDLIRFSQMPGYTHFQGMFLLVDAKDLKMQLKSSTIAGCWQLFTDFLEGDLDFKSLDPSFQFLDLGLEVLGEHGGLNCFYRKCCLEESLKQLREKSTGLKASTYSWALTTLTANQTFAYSKSSTQYQNGLIYSQYYSPLKSLFDAGGTYPLQNTSLDYLSLPPELFKLWQASGNGGERFQVDREKLGKSYIHCRDRILLSLKGAIQQNLSFGIRQEHRLSFQLFLGLKDKSDQIVISQQPKSCFMQESSEVFHFLYGNFLRFGLGLEYTATRLKTLSYDLTQDDCRIFKMFLQLQKASFSNTMLEAKGDLWRSHSRTGERTLAGLGLKDQLATYRFCWLSPSVMNWSKWAFGSTLATSNTFNYIQIHSTALPKVKHLLQQKSQWEILEKLGELLKEIQDVTSQQVYKILAYMGTLVIQRFRIDVWTSLFKFCDPEWIEEGEAKKELALSGLLPLDYENVLSFAPTRFCRIKYSNKYKYSLQDRWEILFHSEDKWEKQELRKAWKDKAYRLYFQKCFSIISTACDSETARLWEYLLVQTQFVRSNFLLPSPSKHTFLQKQSQTGQVSSIYWVPIQHCSWVMSDSLRRLPENGSEEDRWKKWTVDYYSSLTDKYESPDKLFMEKLKAKQVLERFLQERTVR